jgi:hypothetical protein
MKGIKAEQFQLDCHYQSSHNVPIKIIASNGKPNYIERKACLTADMHRSSAMARTMMAM